MPKPGKGAITSTKNAFNAINAVNVGIFDINEDLNNTYIYAPIDLAQDLLSYKPNQVSAIEFKINEGVDELVAKQKIQTALGDKVDYKK